MFWTSWNCFADIEGYTGRLARYASCLALVRIVFGSGQRGEWWWVSAALGWVVYLFHSVGMIIVCWVSLSVSL
jgi:hypothetical protein